MITLMPVCILSQPTHPTLTYTPLNPHLEFKHNTTVHPNLYPSTQPPCCPSLIRPHTHKSYPLHNLGPQNNSCPYCTHPRTHNYQCTLLICNPNHRPKSRTHKHTKPSNSHPISQNHTHLTSLLPTHLHHQIYLATHIYNTPFHFHYTPLIN